MRVVGEMFCGESLYLFIAQSTIVLSVLFTEWLFCSMALGLLSDVRAGRFGEAVGRIVGLSANCQTKATHLRKPDRAPVRRKLSPAIQRLVPYHLAEHKWWQPTMATRSRGVAIAALLLTRPACPLP